MCSSADGLDPKVLNFPTVIFIGLSGCSEPCLGFLGMTGVGIGEGAITCISRYLGSGRLEWQRVAELAAQAPLSLAKCRFQAVVPGHSTLSDDQKW